MIERYICQLAMAGAESYIKRVPHPKGGCISASDHQKDREKDKEEITLLKQELEEAGKLINTGMKWVGSSCIGGSSINEYRKNANNFFNRQQDRED